MLNIFLGVISLLPLVNVAALYKYGASNEKTPQVSHSTDVTVLNEKTENLTEGKKETGENLSLVIEQTPLLLIYAYLFVIITSIIHLLPIGTCGRILLNAIIPYAMYKFVTKRSILNLNYRLGDLSINVIANIKFASLPFLNFTRIYEVKADISSEENPS